MSNNGLSSSCHSGQAGNTNTVLRVNPKSIGNRKPLGEKKEILKTKICIIISFLMFSFEFLDSDSGIARNKTQHNINNWHREM